ncbi:hypothetical protein [Streptomyces sp. NBC_00467]|uniref:hypothetical protein n=1 Tax=Streptomyces sp. NBC_00467 TaxID=2975752 RepID=UPI002E16BF6E
MRHLARLRLPSVRLAYLSACDTLRTSPELADEAVHIVSVLQIAGFPPMSSARCGTSTTPSGPVSRRACMRP